MEKELIDRIMDKIYPTRRIIEKGLTDCEECGASTTKSFYYTAPIDLVDILCFVKKEKLKKFSISLIKKEDHNGLETFMCFSKKTEGLPDYCYYWSVGKSIYEQKEDTLRFIVYILN